MSLKDDWKKAKKQFEAAIQNTSQKDSLKKLGKGADFGPALEKFEKAKTFEEKQETVTGVLKAKTNYEALMDKAEKDADADQKKAIGVLHKALLEIWKEVEDLAQPPRPGGGSVKHDLLRSFNLAAGVKVKFLDVKATQVDVYVEIDAVLDKLIKEGKESLKIDHLGNVAKAEVEKVRDDFVATIQGVEKKIQALALDVKERDAKIKEANEVLKHYAQIVEDRVNTAIQSEWKKYLSRKKYLSDFRIKSGVKIVLGTIGVGVAVASAVLSFGALWMNVVVAAKGIMDVAKTIQTLAEGIDTTYEKLQVDVVNVNRLNMERAEAKKTGASQAGSKSKEAAKELLNQLAPFTKALTTSANTAGDRARQFLGQIAQLENTADDLVGKLNQAVGTMTKLPEKDMTPELKKIAADMDKTFQKTFTEITALHTKAQNGAKFGERAVKAVETLKKSDSWGLDSTEIAGKYGARAAALYGAANFIFECAMHGKALIPM
jgi:hypothetical protein